MQYLITTVPGLEDFVVEELAERLPVAKARAQYLTGRVVAEVDAEPPALFGLKTAERFGIFLGDGSAGALREVVEVVRAALPAAERYLSPSTTVGVRCERVGEHAFTSQDVEREAGRLFKERGYVISLVEPDVEVNVDVVGSYVAVWVTVARRSLKDRPWRAYEHYAGLNPIIAQAMVRLAGPRPGEVLCDLTCGGGTIVAEAAEAAPQARYICVDIELRHVRGALANTRRFPQVDVLWFDSTKLHRLLRPICDKYVFNPPYGFRMPGRIGRLYGLLGAAMRRLARGSCAKYVAITPRHKTFKSQVGGEVLLERTIYQGGLYSHIIVGEVCRG
ncbi:MAG: THUMP domain-containing protein [Thermoproteus sp.]